MRPERSTKCFLLQPSGLHQIRLRRFTRDGGECQCLGNYGYHDASFIIDTPFKLTEDEDVNKNIHPGEVHAGIAYDDLRWPTHCACGYEFPDSVGRQFFPEELYGREGTAELVTLRNAPHGAMWYATWMEDYPAMCGPDGKALVVKVHGREWLVDSRASNCTMPDDNVHKCWIRHGSPPNVTVDKQGHTCAAGAGSIWVGMNSPDGWHGFLRNGFLEEC